MPSTDDRIVSMSFENSKFENGVRQSLSTLGKLKESLNFTGAGRGFDEIGASASRLNLSGIADSVDSIRGKFSALGVIGVTALANIANRAINAGINVVKAFTITPIMAGFHNYETQIQAVQTIMANTGLKGAKGMAQVNAVLKDLNHYANLTVYNFSDMAKNIGTFTAAGVDLKTATASIKGIANLAALSGSTSEQASTAMYQLSQAIAAGQVHLQDWNSVVNAGIGGSVFQKALANTAEAMGTLKANAVQMVGPMKTLTINGQSFRNSISTSGGGKNKPTWLTSGVLTTALKNFTGDMSKAQLAAEGFTASQIKSIQAQAQTAVNAATKIKTLSQLSQALKEEVATAYAAIFKTIFGNIGQATAVFSKAHTVIENALTGPIYKLNNLLETWSKLGGRTDVINGIKAAAGDLAHIFQLLKIAWQEVFPPTTANELVTISKKFEDFFKSLKIGGTTAKEVRQTFAGIFAVFDIGRQIVGGIISVIEKLFGTATKNAGGFLALTASVGKWLVNLDKAIKQGKGLTDFFAGLGKVLAVPVKIMGEIHAAIIGLFLGFDHKAGDSVHNLFSDISKSGSTVGDKLKAIGQYFANLGHQISSALGGVNWSTIFDTGAVGIVGGLLFSLKKVLGHGIGEGFAKVLFGTLTESVEVITGHLSENLEIFGGNLKAFQRSVNAKALLTIAAAVALLTASMLALSFLNGDQLQRSLAGVGIAFGYLLGAMKIMSNIGSIMTTIKLPLIAASMILLAGAIDVLVAAVVIMSRLSWEQLAKGLGGVAGLLAAISAASIPLSRNSKGMIAAGAGISAMAVGINIMALAVKQFAGMDWVSLGKGIGAVAAVLVSVAVASRIFPKSMVSIGAGLILISSSMLIMSKAIDTLGNMDLKTLGIGIGAIAASLVAIGAAMRLMPKGMVVQAAGLVLIGVALHSIDKAIGTLGGMSIETLAKGIGALGVALGILAVGLDAMSGSMAGAAALTIAAAGIAILAPALGKLGHESWLELAKGIAGLAAAMVVLGVAGAAIEPVAPALLALGAATVLIGGGFALLGLGVTAIAAGIAALVVSGPEGIKLLVQAFVDFSEALPKILSNAVDALASMADTIAKDAPQFVTAIGKILVALADAVVSAAPQLARAFIALVDAALKVITSEDNKIIDAGLKILTDLLTGLEQNISGITNLAANIIIKFLDALSNKADQILNAGAKLIENVAKGIANNAEKVISAITTIITHILDALGNSGERILKAGGELIAKLVDGISAASGDVLKAGANAIAHYITGLGQDASKIIAAGTTAILKFVEGLAQDTVKLTDGAAKAVLTLLRGLDAAVKKYEPQIISEGIQIGVDIVTGIIKGIGSEAGHLASSLGNLAKSIPGKIGHLLGISSPSRVMAEQGKYIVQGLALGINSNKDAGDAITKVSHDLIKNVKDIFQISSPSRVMIALGQQVGQGFAQGLRGSTTQIKAAYTSMGNQLESATLTLQSQVQSQQKAVEAAAKTVKAQQDALAKLSEGPKIDTASVDKVKAKLASDQANLDKLTNSSKASAKQISAARNSVDADQLALERANKTLGDNSKAISDAQAKLTADEDALTKAGNALQLSEALLGQVTAAHKEFTGSLKTDRDDLLGLANDYQTVATKLKAAQTALQNAKQAKDQAEQGYDQQYSTLPTITTTDANGNPVDPLTTYTQGLSDQATSVTKYMATLDQLRKLGLDDTTYKKLLDDGTADQQFADELLAGGKTAIDGVDKLDNQLNVAASALATDAGNNLYNAGIAAAQGVVNGLASQEKAIEDEMGKIAEKMIKELKKKLKIKSPSQVFAEIGKFSSQGMANGLASSSDSVTSAASDLGDSAVTAVKKSIRTISSTISDGIDSNPVITPVIDLSQVHAGVKKINALTNSPTLVATTSYSQANAIDASKPEVNTDTAGGVTKVLEFNQTNSSPEALSPIDIYRQTKNQLSQAKSMLETI